MARYLQVFLLLSLCVYVCVLRYSLHTSRYDTYSFLWWRERRMKFSRIWSRTKWKTIWNGIMNFYRVYDILNYDLLLCMILWGNISPKWSLCNYLYRSIILDIAIFQEFFQLSTRSYQAFKILTITLTMLSWYDTKL